jgi:hypothetical protein
MIVFFCKVSGKKPFKETVTIPGAEALCLRFDPKCYVGDSSSENLYLLVSSSLDKSNGKQQKPISFCGSDLPKRSLIVKGDTVTFILNYSSFSESRNQSLQWCFRCIVSEADLTSEPQPLIPHWSLELENTVALFAAKCTATLIEGTKSNSHSLSLSLSFSPSLNALDTY